MEQNANVKYDEDRGWGSFPGYQAHSFRHKGRLPPSIDTVLRAGVDLFAPTGSVTTEVTILRFDQYVVAHWRCSPVDFIWKRERSWSHGRGLAVFLERGSLLITSEDRRIELEAKQLAIVPPGTERVVMHADRGFEVTLFSFDVSEVDSTRLSWHHSAGGIVRQSVLGLLEAAAKRPQPSNPQSSSSLRALLRTAATALVVESRDIASHQDTDTFALVHLIVENRFHDSSFSVDGIAREAGLSRRALERRLRDSGATPGRMLRARRVQKALELKREMPGLPSSEVALRSGFASSVTMRRAIAAETSEQETNQEVTP
ncbi:helix-turn-helix domain-containing protein [Pseudoclavibacter sp. AY1F1]|uniref:AraC family transcriptional regulator n=1 Tax=Pseudoclavibacter sp. AY1F1 TaxID=2080583 RepID=UPI0015E3080B|nr:helix-turn-helix domain-containing protein [Pseudoclavibacter sp. AY1F1]